MARMHTQIHVSGLDDWGRETVRAVLILLGVGVGFLALFAYDGVLDYGSPVEARLKLTAIFVYSALYYLAVNIYPRVQLGFAPEERVEKSDLWAICAIGFIFHYFILWVYFNEVNNHHLIGSLFVMCFVIHLIGLAAAARYFVVPSLFLLLMFIGGFARMFWGGMQLLYLPELSGWLLHFFPSF